METSTFDSSLSSMYTCTRTAQSSCGVVKMHTRTRTGWPLQHDVNFFKQINTKQAKWTFVENWWIGRWPWWVFPWRTGTCSLPPLFAPSSLPIIVSRRTRISFLNFGFFANRFGSQRKGLRNAGEKGTPPHTHTHHTRFPPSSYPPVPIYLLGG